jgi:hypothetical protein
VSLAILINQTGGFSESLLRWLQSLPMVRDDPRLAWQVEDLLGHTFHTYGDLRSAIRHTRKVIRMKTAVGEPKDAAKDLVWLGYEHLCLAKRPNPRKLLHLVRTPFFVWTGLQLLRQGVEAADSEERPQLRNMAAYYRADLLHSWASFSMIAGWWCVRLSRPLFSTVVRMYGHVAEESDVMEAGYYWLRHLEARLLAGCEHDYDRMLVRLDELERAYELTQNNVQMGNVMAYRALIAFLRNGEAGKEAACRYLDAAENAWAASAEGVVSGARRVLLFRRLMGQISLSDSLRILLRET